jgi:hypothetical protein
LKPRTLTERHPGTDRVGITVNAAYLRDRDFDYDPPADLLSPTVDAVDGGSPFGWRWCRHEIENYLIEPVVVSEAMGWVIPDVEQALWQAALKIRNYEAARWTVGVVRRALPPHYELPTRPDGLNELKLPAAIDTAAVCAWASESIERHRGSIDAVTDPACVQASLTTFASRFDDAFVADVRSVLVWFSGKDLLAGMADWLTGKGFANPGEFRASLRDWIIANPVRALALLPEWTRLTEILRA